MSTVANDAADRFRRDGWLHLPAAVEPAVIDELRAECDRFEAWARGGGPGLHHFEQATNGPALARSEQLVESSTPVADLCVRIGTSVGAVLGEPAVLFKEKINYKHPGGGGFAPHQDAAAYRFVDHHVSCMVPLDPATVHSGCLEVAPGHRRGRLPTDEHGCIDDVTAGQLDWRPIECQPGDLLLFDSYTPHRSGTNRSDRPRRAFYLTYNAASLGDHRDRYYADKRAELERGGDIDDVAGQRVRVSITGDFLGRPVDDGLDDLLALYRSPRADRCYDEAVTEREHALQAAALARADGADDALVVAALLHDVGHLLDPGPDAASGAPSNGGPHEIAGAAFLRRWFGADVTGPIELHVDAKRYLCAVDDGYAASLSPASVASMRVQGSMLTPDEAATFAAQPHADAAVALRRYDDLAKEAGRRVAGDDRPGIDAHEPLLRRVIRAGTAS